MQNYRPSVRQLIAVSSIVVLAFLTCAIVAFAQAPLVGTVLRNANLRAGPGTNFAIVGSAQSGQRLTIVSQNAEGNWYQLDSGQWIAAFLVKRTDGATVATPVTPSAPPTTPTAEPATPAPTATEANDQDKLPPNQGCYLFQNYLGAELTITLTGSNNQLNLTFKVPHNQETPVCLDPGPYTYTIDAPPPWNSINGGLDVKAGKYFRFPVEGRK